MRRNKIKVVILISVLALVILFWTIELFNGSQPIKIGVIGTVTGPSSDWGIS